MSNTCSLCIASPHSIRATASARPQGVATSRPVSDPPTGAARYDRDVLLGLVVDGTPQGSVTSQAAVRRGAHPRGLDPLLLTRRQAADDLLRRLYVVLLLRQLQPLVLPQLSHT